MIHKNYQGGDIVLPKDPTKIIDAANNPELKDMIGMDIITTDGTTLLGADDKAGIAEIMDAMNYLIQHPEIKHGTIRVCFTPDEEVGRGTEKFNVAKYGAKYAYTIDGSSRGELETETFSADAVVIKFFGKNIHPGYAKNKMINSMLVAMELNEMLPVNERPEFTQDYEGFFHLIKFDGAVEKSTIQYIIRDHDRAKFEKKKILMQQVCEFMNKKYREGTVTLEMKDQYYNMREKVEPEYHIVQAAVDAMNAVGVEPIVVPIRGGTDGSRLSYMGLPCPNLFAGGHNFHGKYEYIPLQSLEKSVEVILKIIDLYANK